MYEKYLKSSKIQVKSSFRIQRVENGDEAAFGLSNLNGVVPAKGETHIQVIFLEFSCDEKKVLFAPQCSGVFATDTFKVVTPGGNSVTIRCYGRATGNHSNQFSYAQEP